MAYKVTSVITNKIYPMIANSMEKNTNSYLKCIERFMISRKDAIYDIVPCDRIYFGKNELDDFFTSIKIPEQNILNELKNAFFYDIPYNPPQIKEPFVVAMMCIIRYFLIKKKQKESEISAIYLAFSGKFYASVHAYIMPFVPSRPVMEYVVNYKLSEKYDLRREGTVFGAIKSLSGTWMNTYKDIITSKDFDDDECGSVIQQLRDREKSFLKNLMGLYMESYENKDYLNYESDNMEDGSGFRLADSDALMANKYTESTMTYLTTNAVNYKYCIMCSDQNVKQDEIKFIIESILSDNKNIPQVQEVVNIIIADFISNNRGKPLGSVDFIAYSIKMKPNSKDKNIIRMKKIILSWLDENSPNYRKRKSRNATAVSYFKAILQYFVLVINQVTK